MAASGLHAFVRIEDDVPSQRKATPYPESPTVEHLDAMPMGTGALYTGPVNLNKPEPATLSGDPDVVETGNSAEPWAPSSSQDPNELEMNQPGYGQYGTSIDVIQSWNNPSINKWRLLSTFLVFLGNGMNDSAPGALLPYMEKYYGIDYATVSLIFILNAAGFILAAFFVHSLNSKLGRAKTNMFCELVVAAGYLMMAFAPPFPLMPIGFFVTGWGIATILALNNVLGANLSQSTIILGAMHGSYGIGGTIAPIIATAMVTKGVLFSKFYFILFALRTINIFFGGWSFWNKERDDRVFAADAELPSSRVTIANLHPMDINEATERQNNESNEVKTNQSKVGEFLHALKNRTTLFGAVFIFAYQGAEVTISGWVISFLISYRGSDASKVGYVTAGFWGGITIGRFILSIIGPRIGEKPFTYGLVVGALGFQLLLWFEPNVIGDAVAVALLGFLLGPVYPCATAVFGRLLRKNKQNTALAFISSAGSSGGAIAPFVTGLAAQQVGTWVLNPVCVSMYVVMELCWFSLPSISKRKD